MKYETTQTSFIGGVISPRFRGRVDDPRYKDGVERLENVYPTVQGGGARRWGRRFLHATKNAGAQGGVLIPYVFNRYQCYMLLFGAGYVWVFNSDGSILLSGGVPLEMASPYALTDLATIDAHQADDTLFLFHPTVPTQRVRRLSASIWALTAVNWTVIPFAEIGTLPNSPLGLSTTAPGAGATFTSAVATVPGAPVIGVAVAGNGSAAVQFTPGASGGTPITTYTATASPGGLTGNATASPVNVPGLTNGTAYTFTVTATNSVGASAASAASNSVTPNANAIPVVSVTPLNFSISVDNGKQLVQGPIATDAGGTAPLSLLWSILSGPSGLTLQSATTAQVGLWSSASNAVNVAALRCVVTDATGHSSSTDVNVAITHGTPGAGDGGPTGGGNGGGGGKPLP